MTYRTPVTIDQHLAWPETRIQHLITWLNRPIEGWEPEELTKLFYDRLSTVDGIQDEAHF